MKQRQVQGGIFTSLLAPVLRVERLWENLLLNFLIYQIRLMKLYYLTQFYKKMNIKSCFIAVCQGKQ